MDVWLLVAAPSLNGTSALSFNDQALIDIARRPKDVNISET